MLKTSKYKIRLLRFVFAILLGCTLFILFWSLPPGERIVNKIISDQISRLLNLNFQIQNFETNLFSRIHLSGIILSFEKDSTDLISIDDLQIKYRLFSLFRKNLYISTIAVDGFFLDIDIAKSDTLLRSRLEKFVPVQDFSKPSNQFSIDRLILSNAAIKIDDKRVPLHFQADGLDIEGIPVSTDTMAYVVHLRRGKGFYRKSSLNLSECSVTGKFSAKHSIHSAFLEVNTLQMDSISVNQLQARGQFDTEKVSIDSFQLRFCEGILSGSGKIGREESQLGYFSMNIEGIPLSQLQSSLNHESALVEGHINGFFHASGSGTAFKKWEALAELYLSDVRTQKHPFPPYRIDLHYAVHQMNLTLSHETSKIVADLQLHQNGFTGTYSLSVPKTENISFLFMPDPIYGKVSGKGQIQNMNNRFVIDLDMQGANLQYQQYHSDSLHARIAYDQNQLRIHDFQVFRPSGWNQEHEPMFDSVPFSFYMNGEFNLQNQTGSVKASIHSAQNKSIVFHPDSSWGDITCDIKGSQNNIETIRAWGELKHLSIIRNLIPGSPSYDGQFAFQTEYQRNVSEHQITLESRIKSPSFRDQALADSMQLKAHMQNNHIDSFQISIYQDMTQHRITGSIKPELDLFSNNLNQAFYSQGSIHLDSLDMQWIAPWLPDNLRASGFVNTEINWEGTFQDLHPAGFIVLNADIHHQTQQWDLENLNLNLTLQDTTAVIPLCRFNLQSIPVSLKAQIVRFKDNSLQFHADTDVYEQKALSVDGFIQPDSIYIVNTVNQLPLSLFEPLYAEMHSLSGIIDANLTIAGTVESFRINGELAIQDMTFSPQWSETPFSDGYIHLLFTDNQFHLDTLVLNQNQGYVGSSGFTQIDKNKITQLVLKTELSKLRINRLKQYDMQIQNAHIELKSERDAYLLNGLIVMDKSVIQNAITPSSLIQKIQSRDRPSTDRPDYFQKVQIDIRIQESENLWLDNQFAKVRLHPELRLTGYLDTVRLTGRVTVREGYLLYLDRKFQIDRGILDFTDPNRINPAIYLIAVNRLGANQSADQKSYTITLTLQGPLDNARLQLASEPFLDEADILTLLTVGSTRQVLTGRGTENLTMLDLLRERAASLSNERIINYTSRTVNETLKFAEISITGNLFRQDSESPTVTASRNIFQRISITYSTRIGHINDQSIRLNYQLHNRLMLQGETDRYGRSGLDLIYGIGIK